MRFKRIYIEITNVCNLNCEFCEPHNRENRFMTLVEFESVLNKISNYSSYIYLHVKGEPLLHPDFDKIVKLAYSKGFQINLTTNATLLENHLESTQYLRQINISFHATNNEKILQTTKKISNCIVNYRIWNFNENNEALELIKKEFNISKDIDFSGISNYTLAPNIFLSLATRFEWPTLDKQISSNGYCHALKDQIAILVDGTVVPCCLDNNGDIALGNIFEESLEEILEKEKTKKIIDGFKNRIAVEDLCKKCTYKNRF
jgi:radical SAM protein with 4Fe4S-binding SPASM domain